MLLYNSMTRQKEEFVPVREGRVNMYVCGITAYDLCHIGHARSAVVFDVLVRHLRSRGLAVKFVRNFTDVDDKIIKRAAEEGAAPGDIADKYINAFYEDMDRLGILRPDEEPRCTEYIDQMQILAQRLIDKGHAYATASGDVYFRVRSKKDYGRLSGRDIEEMRSGARVAPGEDKEDPLDFALWKAAKPGEPQWDGPWGPGRPGWHLECSAMSESLMELPLDIHGGGRDLIFPHHENEIAQSEAAVDGEFCRWWVHNGFVQINTEKMSKSLGNFVTIRDIYEKYLPETLRFFLVSSHYRSPLDYSDAALDEAEKGLRRIYAALAQIDVHLARKKWSGATLPQDVAAELAKAENDWKATMDDDLNTAAAMGCVFTMVRLANRVMEDKALGKCKDTPEFLTRITDALAGFGEILGVPASEPQTFLAALRDCKVARKGLAPAKIEDLMQQRQTARKEKDFARADAIRDELAAMDVEVMDTPQGPVWDVN